MHCGILGGMILAVPEAVWSLIAAIVLVIALALIFRRTIEQVLIPRVSGIKVLRLEVTFAKEELDPGIQEIRPGQLRSDAEQGRPEGGAGAGSRGMAVAPGSRGAVGR